MRRGRHQAPLTLMRSKNFYMALPVQFPEMTNPALGKPEGWTDDQCMSLPVWQGPIQIDDTGTTAMGTISKWKFSKEDLEEINRTGEVYLSVIFGRNVMDPNSPNGYREEAVMVPVCIFTEHPWNTEKPVGSNSSE
jgi:hypothetical protein